MNFRSLFSKFLLPVLIVAGALVVARVLIATQPGAKPVAVTEKAWLVRVEPAMPRE